MNRLLKEILFIDEFVGRGCERAAYSFNDKIFKFPVEGNEGYQVDFERDVWDCMPDKYKQFFPNPVWFGRIVMMDKAIIAEEIDYEYDSEFEDFVKGLPRIFQATHGDYELVRFAHSAGLNIDWELFGEFLEWFSDQGGVLYDIFDNTGNFGIRNGRLQIVDWGLSHDS